MEQEIAQRQIGLGDRLGISALFGVLCAVVALGVWVVVEAVVHIFGAAALLVVFIVAMGIAFDRLPRT